MQMTQLYSSHSCIGIKIFCDYCDICILAFNAANNKLQYINKKIY